MERVGLGLGCNSENFTETDNTFISLEAASVFHYFTSFRVLWTEFYCVSI